VARSRAERDPGQAGDRSPALALLRQRLAASDDLPAESRAGDTLDAPLSEAIKRFQNRHGIEETGLVGPRTLVALNIPAPVRLRQIQASAERILGSNFAFGERYVVVNIPAAAVEAVQGGTVVRRYTPSRARPTAPRPRSRPGSPTSISTRPGRRRSR
jgi:murein L,D-transpeptidase YcbB/YkuD